MDKETQQLIRTIITILIFLGASFVIIHEIWAKIVDLEKLDGAQGKVILFLESLGALMIVTDFAHRTVKESASPPRLQESESHSDIFHRMIDKAWPVFLIFASMILYVMLMKILGGDQPT